MHLMCHHCTEDFWGGVSRMKHHLAGTHFGVKPCLQVSDDVRNSCAKMLNGLEEKNCVKSKVAVPRKESHKKSNMDDIVIKDTSKQKTIDECYKDGEPVVRDICRFLYGNALPFNLVKESIVCKDNEIGW